MKLNTLWLILLLVSGVACKQNNSKTELLNIRVVPENSSHHGIVILDLNGAGELRDIGFHLVKTIKNTVVINMLQRYSQNNQVFEIDITLNAEDKPSWIPFTELNRILNEVKAMAEEYNCKTIVYIHSDRIK